MQYTWTHGHRWFSGSEWPGWCNNSLFWRNTPLGWWNTPLVWGNISLLWRECVHVSGSKYYRRHGHTDTHTHRWLFGSEWPGWCNNSLFWRNTPLGWWNTPLVWRNISLGVISLAVSRLLCLCLYKLAVRWHVTSVKPWQARAHVGTYTLWQHPGPDDP